MAPGLRFLNIFVSCIAAKREGRPIRLLRVLWQGHDGDPNYMVPAQITARPR